MRACLLLGAALCLSSAALASPQTSEAPGLTFGWPVPSTVDVIETTRDAGKVARFKHRVELSKQGDELRLRFLESKPLKVGSVDLEGGPQLGGELAKVAAFYPELRIGLDGKPLGTVGVEEAIARWIRLAQELDPTLDEQRLIRARERLLASRDMLENRALDLWQLWAAAWIGAPSTAGETVEREESIPIGEVRVRASSTLAHRGEGKAGAVHLVREVRVGGEEARAAFEALARSVSGTDGRVVRFERTTRLEVFTDPKTLRPRLAATRQVTRITAEGEEPRVRTEQRQFTFQWVN